MAENQTQTEKFLKEGTEYFETQRFPQFFPTYIKQISESINEFNKSIEKSSKVSEKLTNSIKNLTLWGVIISAIALIWNIIKFFLPIKG